MSVKVLRYNKISEVFRQFHVTVDRMDRCAAAAACEGMAAADLGANCSYV
jgi:hypothetical protein